MLDTDKEEEPCSASLDPWTDGDECECEGVDEDREDREDREEREERGGWS